MKFIKNNAINELEGDNMTKTEKSLVIIGSLFGVGVLTVSAFAIYRYVNDNTGNIGYPISGVFKPKEEIQDNLGIQDFYVDISQIDKGYGKAYDVPELNGFCSLSSSDHNFYAVYEFSLYVKDWENKEFKLINIINYACYEIYDYYFNIDQTSTSLNAKKFIYNSRFNTIQFIWQDSLTYSLVEVK